MFLVDMPYVSDFFKQTVKENKIPVVGTKIAYEIGLLEGTHFIREDEAIELYKTHPESVVYTTSENAISWLVEHLSFTDLPERINCFKNKLKFREITASIFPDFVFKEVQVNDLESVNLAELPLPFIIKPTIGFFSMGVYKVSAQEEWLDTIDLIKAEMKDVKGLYPEAVLDTGSFIIEQCIDGDEFAVDAYYDANGEPVILNILQHVFASDTDVSDRVYITSKELIEQNLEEFTAFVGNIGSAAGAKNFPVHIELRREKNGKLLPIEVNPMRFGGWCTTADLAHHAYGFNPYLYYYDQKKPDWPELLTGKDGKLYSIIALGNSTGRSAEEINIFDYKKMLSIFEKPLELRKINYHEYPIFGVVFTETRMDNFAELTYILNSDLLEFVS